MRRCLVLIMLAVFALPTAASAAPFSVVRGTVLDTAGQPLGRACVKAYYADDQEWWAESAAVGADGTYSMVLGDDAYKFHFGDCDDYNGQDGPFIEEWYDDADSFSTATTVYVGDEPVVTVDAVLSRGASISGTTFDERYGAPSGAACLALYDEAERVVVYDYPYDTQNWGEFHIGGLRAGTYRLFADGCGGGFRSEWWQDADSFAEATPLVLAHEQAIAGLRIDLALGGAIKGALVDQRGAPAEWTCVSATDGVATFRGNVSMNGTYTINGLPDGTYRVRYGCGDDAFETEWYRDATNEADALPIVIAGASTVGADAVLRRLPAPDGAVTSVAVRNVPLRTDDSEIGALGTSRVITVETANFGEALARGTLYVLSRAVTTGDTHEIYAEDLELNGGERRTVTAPWQARQVGDVEIIACFGTWYGDADPRNNQASTQHYTVVGGTGFGAGAPVGPWSGTTRDCDRYYAF